MAKSRQKQDPEREIDDHERMVLIGADSEVFLAAVKNPPEPTERLVAALRRHHKNFGIGRLGAS